MSRSQKGNKSCSYGRPRSDGNWLLEDNVLHVAGSITVTLKEDMCEIDVDSEYTYNIPVAALKALLARS